MLQMQQMQFEDLGRCKCSNGTWHIASAAIDARAAMQSRCDANAAIILG
tara:strand:+ start:1177 stop:1323 length:147 start_codon:yes stop_codon:yes gene_type:complete